MGSHTNSTIMAFVESVVKSLNTRIGTLESEHLATVYLTEILLIQTATAGFYVGIENNTLMAIPIFYKAGYPWLGPGGIIDGCATLWNVCFWGILLFTDGWGGKKSAGLVKLAFVLVIGFGTGRIVAYYPNTDINDSMQWAPTLFTVRRTIHCFLLAAWSEPRDRKHFYMRGTFLSFLQNLFIIENGTPVLGLDLICIAILIGPQGIFKLVEDGSWAVYYASLLSILRETLQTYIFGNWSPEHLYNGSTYMTLAIICAAYVIIYTERNLFPDIDSKEEKDFVTQACAFFFDFVTLFVMIVKKAWDKVYFWFVKDLLLKL